MKDFAYKMRYGLCDANSLFWTAGKLTETCVQRLLFADSSFDFTFPWHILQTPWLVSISFFPCKLWNPKFFQTCDLKCLGAAWISGLTSDMFAVQQVSLCIAPTCEAALLARRKTWTNRLHCAICRIISATFFFLALNKTILSRLQTKYQFGRQRGDLKIVIHKNRDS